MRCRRRMRVPLRNATRPWLSHTPTAAADELVPAAWAGRAAREQPVRSSQPPTATDVGLQTDLTAQVVIARHAFVQNLRRDHYEPAVDVRPALRVIAALTELAHAI